MLFIRLYSFSTVLENSTSFVFLLQKKKNPTDTCSFFKSTYEFENWHISYFDLPVHEHYI